LPQRNAAVAMKWAALLEFDVPVDLLEAMRVQKTACETIIGSTRQPFLSIMGTFFVTRGNQGQKTS
jgi:hypothetical protein